MTQRSEVLDEVYFYGGMDSDSDERFLEKGDYRDAANVIRGYKEDGEGRNGVLSTMPSTDKLKVDSQVDLSYELVGRCEYEKRDGVLLFFRKNTTGKGSIYFVSNNKSSRSLEPIYSGRGDAGFADGFVSATMIEDIVIWCDSTNEVYYVNAGEALDNGTAFESSTENEYSLLRKPPLYQPSFEYGYNSSFRNNRVVIPCFQFKEQYVYDDYRKSSWGLASDVAYNPMVAASPQKYDESTVYNYIDVLFNSGDSGVDVINLAARTSFNGDWFLVEKISKAEPSKVYSTGGVQQTSSLSDNTNYYYRFTNAEQQVGLDQNEVDNSYNAIPTTCETVESTVDNRLLFGGCTEGKDMPSGIDLDFSVNYTDEDTFSVDLTVVRFEETREWGVRFPLDGSDSVYGTINRLDSVNVGDVIVFDFDYGWSGKDESSSSGGWYIFGDSISYVFTTPISGVDNVGNHLASNLNAELFSAYYSFQGGEETEVPVDINYDSSANELQFTFSVDEVYTDVSDGKSDNETFVVFASGGLTDFKDGSKYQFAIIHYDEFGRKWPAIVDDDAEVYVQRYDERSAGELGRAYMSWTLSGTPPSGAVKYRMAMAYKPKNFVQMLVWDAYRLENTDAINLALQMCTSNNPNNTYNYTFEAGDFLRIVWFEGNDGSRDYSNTTTYIVKDVRSSITDEDGTDRTGLFLVVEDSNFNTYNNFFAESLVEVYKSTVNYDDTQYFEIGPSYDISSGTYDTTSDDLYAGDVYRRYRIMSTGIVVQGEVVVDPYPTDSNPNLQLPLDRPNVVFPEEEEKYQSIIRWSGKYFQGTQVNGLATVDLSNKKDITDKYGRITGLEQLGSTLTVLAERKTFTAYLGATEYVDASGQTQVVKSDSVIGYVRASADDYGTVFKESIVNTGRAIYFFDIYNSTVVRKAANGNFPLSSYKMINDFRIICTSRLQSLRDNLESDEIIWDRLRVPMGWDSRYNNLFVGIMDYTTNGFSRDSVDNSYGFIFHEPSNRWISRVDVDDGTKGVLMFFMGKNMIGAVIGEYLYFYYDNSEDEFLTMYDSTQTAYIDFVGTAYPNKVKRYRSVGLHSNFGGWSIDPIYTDYATSRMQSRLKSGQFRKSNGVYRAKFLKNMKTNSTSTSVHDLINGEEIEGRIIKCKLKNSSTEQRVIFKADIASELAQ